MVQRTPIVCDECGEEFLPTHYSPEMVIEPDEFFEGSVIPGEWWSDKICRETPLFFEDNCYKISEN